MTAIADGVSWNPSFTTTRRDGDVIVIEGLAWGADDSELTIRLYLKTDVGSAPQVIGQSSTAAADVMHRPWYTESLAWTASGQNGSGTLVLSSLANGRAKGTFSFTAYAVTPTSRATFRVTSGSFDVPF
jgi:hypothetical protein